MVTLYIPVPPNQDGGIGQVYVQHLKLFNNTVRRKCPWHSFLKEFSKAITLWTKEGYQTSVLGDLNEHINSKKTEAYSSKIGLRDLPNKKHGKECPAITIININKKAVDGIWGTIGLRIKKCGYLLFHLGIKYYHQLIWIKIANFVALG